jgi:hypothetical protein
MGTRLAVFTLLISLIVQSVLTLGCGPDGLGQMPDDKVHVIAVYAPDTQLEAYCSSCGGLRTSTGCCAHGLPLAAAVIVLPRTFFASSIVVTSAPLFPQRSPSSLFRPPIPA